MGDDEQETRPALRNDHSWSVAIILASLFQLNHFGANEFEWVELCHRSAGFIKLNKNSKEKKQKG